MIKNPVPALSFISNAKPFGDMPCIMALDRSRGQEALKYRGDERD